MKNNTIEIAQDIQAAKNGSLYILAGHGDSGAAPKVFCKGPGFRTGQGDAYEYHPVADFVRGTMVVTSHATFRVTGVGKVYEATVDVGVIDEDHSYSGFRKTGTANEKQQRIYVERV